MRRGTLGNELVRNVEPLRRIALDRHAAILLQNRARRAIPANQTPTAATPKKRGARRRLSSKHQSVKIRQGVVTRRKFIAWPIFLPAAACVPATSCATVPE